MLAWGPLGHWDLCPAVPRTEKEHSKPPVIYTRCSTAHDSDTPTPSYLSALFLTSSDTHPHARRMHGRAHRSFLKCHRGPRLCLLFCMRPNALNLQLILNNSH